MTAIPAAIAPAPPDARGRSVGWWGMVLLIATEATIFASLFASYLFIRAAAPEWPPHGIDAPELTRIVLFSFVLVGSSIPVVIAESSMRAGRVPLARVMLALAFLMGLVFLVNQAFEYRDIEFSVHDSAYASLFIVITGLHGLHVLVGLLMSLVVQAKIAVGRLTAARHETLQIFALYWHFVDGVWLFVFSFLYVLPHLG